MLKSYGPESCCLFQQNRAGRIRHFFPISITFCFDWLLFISNCSGTLAGKHSLPHKISSLQWHVSFCIETLCWSVPSGTAYVAGRRTLELWPPSKDLASCAVSALFSYPGSALLSELQSLSIYCPTSAVTAADRVGTRIPFDPSSFRFAWRWLNTMTSYSFRGLLKRDVSSVSSQLSPPE